MADQGVRPITQNPAGAGSWFDSSSRLTPEERDDHEGEDRYTALRSAAAFLPRSSTMLKLTR